MVFLTDSRRPVGGVGCVWATGLSAMRPLRFNEIVLLLLAAVGILAFFIAWGFSSAPDAGDKAFEKGDYETAVREWRALAQEGDAPSQTKLGQMYEMGRGVAQDRAEAANWFRRAAEKGYAPAQNRLGEMHQYGEGVERDYARAVALYRQAAEQGYLKAQANLGGMLYAGLGIPIDAVGALMWFEIAAANGSKAAAQKRDDAVRTMTPAQVDEAKRRARQWLDRHPKKE